MIALLLFLLHMQTNCVSTLANFAHRRCLVNPRTGSVLNLTPRPSALTPQVPGIGKNKISGIAEDVRAHWVDRRQVMSLLDLGLDLAMASQVLEYWGDDAEKLIVEDAHNVLLMAMPDLSFRKVANLLE